MADNCKVDDCIQRELRAEIDGMRKVLDQIHARARAIPGDDLKELQRQMMHIANLSAPPAVFRKSQEVA